MLTQLSNSKSYDRRPHRLVNEDSVESHFFVGVELSTFPSKLRPGNDVTIHLRTTPRAPVWARKEIFIVDPLGRRSLCLDRNLPLLPIHFDQDEFDTIRKSAIGFQANPLLMAARYLSRDSNDTDYFIKTLIALREATHLYQTFNVPLGAPLGKYQVELKTYCEGEVIKSGTAATDFFFVEQLNLLEVAASGETFDAVVENPSTESVIGRLCDRSAEDTGHPERGIRLIELHPKSTTKITVNNKSAFIVYAGGSEILKLSAADDPFCIRNQAFQTLAKPSGITFLFHNSVDRQKAYELDDDAQKIWHLAGRFSTRTMVKTEKNADSYDRMIKHGLILEVY